MAVTPSTISQGGSIDCQRELDCSITYTNLPTPVPVAPVGNPHSFTIGGWIYGRTKSAGCSAPISPEGRLTVTLNGGFGWVRNLGLHRERPDGLHVRRLQ